MPDHHPLDWPAGYPRTYHGDRESSRFQTSLADARDGLIDELGRMDAEYITISSNIETYERRGQRVPYANQAEPSDPGIAVYFQWRGDSYALACDRWGKTAANMQALRKTVGAMRGLDRWGATEMMKRSFSGFQALPEPDESSGEAWWDVLGITREASEEEIERAFKAKAKQAHPDTRSGVAEDWHRLQEARQQALAAVAD